MTYKIKDLMSFAIITRKQYGYTAIVFGLLTILQTSISIVFGIVGIICGTIWVALTIKEKIFEPRVTTLASRELSPDKIKEFLGKDSEKLSNEEAVKLFFSLPPEKQMEAFFGTKES